MSDVIEQFRALEESLWRDSPPDREGILDEDFTEFCRFGAIYDRQHLLQPTDSTVEVAFPFDNFEVEHLTDDVVLVTYENTIHNGDHAQRARRSSIWVNGTHGWKLRFMQATTLEG